MVLKPCAFIGFLYKALKGLIRPLFFWLSLHCYRCLCVSLFSWLFLCSFRFLYVCSECSLFSIFDCLCFLCFWILVCGFPCDRCVCHQSFSVFIRLYFSFVDVSLFSSSDVCTPLSFRGFASPDSLVVLHCSWLSNLVLVFVLRFMSYRVHDVRVVVFMNECVFASPTCLDLY